MDQLSPAAITHASPVVLVEGAPQPLAAIWAKFHTEGIVWTSAATRTQLPTHPHRYHFKFKDRIDLGTIENDDTSVVDSVDWFAKFQENPAMVIVFKPINAAAASAAADDDALVLEISSLKEQLGKKGVKLLVIVTGEIDPARLDHLRKQTSLNSRNGLLYLAELPQKELNLFALDILQIVRPATIEHFTYLEKQIKKGENSIKLGFINELKTQYELALRHFESAYEGLLSNLNSIDLSETDRWIKLRVLLDVIAFRIVRLCLYLEQPNASYRKFDAHIKGVLFVLQSKKIDGYPVINWQGVQYKWLAQLCDLAPTSLVPSEAPFKRENQSRLSTSLLPHSGYLYLQVVDFIRKRGPQDDNTVDPYVLELDSDLINLFTFAKLAFQKRDDVFNRAVAMVNYEIGANYFESQDWEKAFKFLELSLDSVKEDDWSALLAEIHYKLLVCSKELGKNYASVVNYLELGLLDAKFITVKPLQVDWVHDVVINADSSFDLFEATVLFHDSEVPLSKNAELQLTVTSKLNELFGKAVLSDLVLSLQGDSFPSVLINHNDIKPQARIQMLSPKTDADALSLDANLEFLGPVSKVFNLSLPTIHIGPNSISGIIATLKHPHFTVKLNIPVVSNPFRQRHAWVVSENQVKILNRLRPGEVNVTSRVPDISIAVSDAPKFVARGEKFKIPVNVNSTESEPVRVQILAEAEGLAFHWEGIDGKTIVVDDVPKGEMEHELWCLIPQDFPIGDVNSSLKVKYVFVNGDSDEEITSFKNVTFSFCIVDAFKVSVNIQPRLKGEWGELKGNERFWLFKLTTFVDSRVGVRIVDEELSIVSENEDVKCLEDSDLKTRSEDDNKVVSMHYVDTVIQEGKSHRNVALDVTSTIKFERSDGVISTFSNPVWKLALPLLDPRVLLYVKELSPENLQLTFMIENPTGKVFTFSTNLIDSSHFNLVSGSKDMVNVSVEPMERRQLDFVVALNSSGKRGSWHLLPQLRVYDVNYKVRLPTLVVPSDASTQTHKADVFWYFR